MFKFRQFKVFQENAAMKVGTDGVLLGAWTPVSDKIERILDVGTGTGLVALMLAQRCETTRIDAVEIDEVACEDAYKNFEISRWNDRLTLIHETFQTFSETAEIKYDLIISNPPFFSNGVKNNCSRKANARHNEALSQGDLISGVIKLLNYAGTFAVIHPLSDYEEFKLKAARKGLYECQRLMVRPNLQKPVKRVISLWSKKPSGEFRSDELVVELYRHHYSDAFRKITAGFYLV
jgi:tRNA1Val (adenine37-N6)-methyltransferase